MSTFDSTGLTVDDLATILEDMAALLRTYVGENVKVDPDSVFGQIINLQALYIAEQNELAEATANAFNPQAASGVALSSLVLLNGISRNESAFSTVALTFTANTAGTTVPAGAIVSDPSANIQWIIDSEVVVAPSSTNTGSATASEAGAFTADVDTITQIDTPQYGWISVTNSSAASPGQTEETDSSLRVRRQQTVESTSDCSVSKIYQKVGEVSGVNYLKIVENAFNSIDINGVPPQHIWVIANGGSNADIAKAIFENKAAGIGTWGDSLVNHFDSVTGGTYPIYFERPTDIPIYIDIELTAYDTYPIDGDEQVKQALITYFSTMRIGQDVYHSRLFTPINEIDGHKVNSMYIGVSPSPSQSNDISITDEQLAVTGTSYINVTSVNN